MTLIALALGFCAFVSLVVALSTGQEAWAVGTIVLALLGAAAQIIEIIHVRRQKHNQETDTELVDGSGTDGNSASVGQNNGATGDPAAEDEGTADIAPDATGDEEYAETTSDDAEGEDGTRQA